MSNQMIQVMIIEDDEIATKIYERFIQKVGGFHIAATTSSGKHALELFNVFTPDLILLDVFLPDMKGTDLLREIRKNFRNVDVIMITAANDVYTVQESIRGGAFSYLMKPIILDKFMETLEDYKQTRIKLRSLTTVHQDDVNSLFGIKNREESNLAEIKTVFLPKGIDKHTLRKVKEEMQNVDFYTNADELAKILGASHSTARRYLEYLVSNHELEVEVMYGTIGRPERRYRKK